MKVQRLLAETKTRWHHYLITILLVLLLASGVYLLSGEVVLNPLHGASDIQLKVLVELRLPRLFAAIVIGGALAMSGTALQVLLGNPLAEPGVLGISGGASCAMVIMLFAVPFVPSALLLMLAAIMGSMLFTLLLVGLARYARLSTTKLLLIGVALGILSSCIVTWAFYFSDDLSVRELMYWLMGSISGVNWQQHFVSVIMLVAMVWLASQASALDKLMLGEVHARQLGVDVNKLRWRLILVVAVLVGGAVALGGIISFVGLIVPHFLRLACGTQHRYLLPMAALSGATLVVLADLCARTLMAAGELPLGVMTTSIGAPVFIWMLLKNHDHSQSS